MTWMTFPLAALISALSLPTPGSKILLRLDPESGKKVFWYIDTEMNMKMTPPGMPQEMNMNMRNGIGMTLEVASVANQTVTLSNTIDSMSMSMTGMPGMDMNYRSTAKNLQDPNQAAMEETLRPLLESKIVAVFSELGKVQQLQGISELNEALGAGGGTAGMSSNPYENLQAFFPIFSSKKVSPGATWVEEVGLTNNGMPMNVVYTYTLLEVKDNIAKLGVSALIDMPSSTFEQQGMSMSIAMKGTQTGEILVSTRDGFTQSATMRQEFQMDMVTMGMEMPAAITGTVRLTTLD
ncbi:MAG: hypothetical protein GC205_11020 [Bacteroidetes bacterium]|nr:hypothetical protein [Bacteroidota bacterium]